MATNDTCPVCATSDIVCGKWTLLIIRDLAEGRARFCELDKVVEELKRKEKLDGSKKAK